MNVSPKTIRALAAVGVVVLALIVVAVLAVRGGDDPAATTARVPGSSVPAATVAAPTGTATPQRPPQPDPASTRVAGVPDRAYATLLEIDAGRWPDAANAPGTKGGDRWMNRDRTLPATDAAGKPVSYQEWDVNPKQRGRSRDAERIVTGSDRSAWYTGDHYKTFTRMR
ncbi:ribonuclease domain-containing protein [Nocardia sp. NPDC049149]|uniref:ribonuclease domain-containing protein n=1 Tax=Nocardia sp. NPDC049149 TaxID=3364315 RepID=UPI00371A2847